MKIDFTPADLVSQRFVVEYEYPVLFCEGALSGNDGHLLWAIARKEPERRHPVVFVVDDGVAKAWPNIEASIESYVQAHSASLELRSPLLIVAGGEDGKNDPSTLQHLLEAFAQARLDRQSTVVAIGGGAALDVIGYAAALVHRGVRLVRMPTTVLAQNDAGVGVKNGVNAFGAKNFLGTFAPPFAVVNDADWLGTLSDRDARAGLAEAVKVSLIRDAEFFGWLEQNVTELRHAVVHGRPSRALVQAVRRCAALHLQHIRSAGDPFETGSARPLDYGHWAAHRLEMLSGHELRHGEAVAIGMALDARYAEQCGMLGTAELQRILTLLNGLGLPLSHPALIQEHDGKLDVLLGLEQFREHLGGTLSVTMLRGIGESVEVHALDVDRIAEAVLWLAAIPNNDDSPTP